MDTSPNSVFLQKYHEKQIKQLEKKAKSGQKSKVATLVMECRDIRSESQHWVKIVATSAIAVRVVTSAEGCITEGSES